MKIAIVGTGLMGRILALELSNTTHELSLFDKHDADAHTSCLYAGAGMIAPSCELEEAREIINQLGLQSLQVWPQILAKLDNPIFYQHTGTVVVAHPGDHEELIHVKEATTKKSPITEGARIIGQQELSELEPELTPHFSQGIYFPLEGQIDNRAFIEVSTKTILSRKIPWKTNCNIQSLDSHTITHDNETHTFDWVIDTRGLGAQQDLNTLRGVRGELIVVRAPEVHLTRPVRMLHPRYRLYVVPRPNNIYLIGATAIESQDLSPISVRSTLELLSAAYALHTGFAEARILETVVNCRPAFSNNLPKIMCSDGLIRINGLYRHGFLIGPALAQITVDYLNNNSINSLGKAVMEI